MKEVKKPPMWRLVEVPAHYNFLKIHYIIQIIMVFNDTHMWQFNKHAYDPTLCIGMDSEDPSITNNADTTPLTKFLQEPGDKLEYIYDFGDDWIFTIELKDINHTKIKHPSVLKYKEDLNPIDDIGGIYSYLELRNFIAAGYENSETKEFFNDFFMIESEEEYLEFIDDATFDLDRANMELSNTANYTY